MCVCVCGDYDYPVHTHTGVPSLLLHVQQKQCPVPNTCVYINKKVKQLLECLYHYSWLPSSYCIRVMSFVNKCTFFKKSSETSGVSPISHSSFVLRTTYIHIHVHTTHTTCTHLPVYIYQCILFFVPCVPCVCSAHPTALLQLCSKCSCA